MPRYDRECGQCGHTWESEETVAGKLTGDARGMQRVEGVRAHDGSIDASVCPRCATVGSKRLIGPTAFVLKGDRWAKDGYGG